MLHGAAPQLSEPSPEMRQPAQMIEDGLLVGTAALRLKCVA
jgi:hypothetical protein